MLDFSVELCLNLAVCQPLELYNCLFPTLRHHLGKLGLMGIQSLPTFNLSFLNFYYNHVVIL